jgi:hypothetical protein
MRVPQWRAPRTDFDRWFEHTGKRMFTPALKPKNDDGWKRALSVAFGAGQSSKQQEESF